MKINTEKCKEKVTSWIRENIKEDENNQRIQQFIQEVESALEKTEEYWTSWEVGYNITQDENAYRLYIDRELCKIRYFSPHLADNYKIDPEQILHDSFTYEEKDKMMEKKKEEYLATFLEKTIFTEESEKTKEFIAQLEDALKNKEKYETSWIIGKKLTHEQKPFYIVKNDISGGYRFLSEEEEELSEDEEILYETFEYPEKPEDIEEETEEEYQEENNKNAEAYLVKANDSISEKDGYLIPKSKKKIDRFKENLEKAKQEQPTAKELLEEIDTLEGYLKEWEKREYYGSNTELYVVVGFIILIVIGQLTRLVEFSHDTNEPETEKSAFLIIYGILLYASLAGFYWSRKAPRWLIDKRKNRAFKFNPTGFFGKISFSFLNLIGGLPADSYKETAYYSDGSKSENTSMGPFGLLAGGVFAFTIIFWIAYLHFFILLLPFWAAIGLLRNYVLFI